MSHRKALAGAMYDNERLTETLHMVICGALSRSFRGGYEIKRLDEYDGSIEFWSYPDRDLDEIDREVLWLMGFDRCWVCYQELGSEGGERPTGEERYYDATGHVSATVRRTTVTVPVAL